MSRTRDNEIFRREAEEVDLRYRCRDCDHYAPGKARCSLEFESAWLTTGEIHYLNAEGRVVFCKYFELES